jgi:hypothetical protein
MSTRENILAALHAQLSTLLPASVYRSRREQLPALPAIVIRPESDTDDGLMLGVRDSTLTVSIDIYADGEIPDQALDDLITDTLQALDADATLGLGADVQILPARQIEWSTENYDHGQAQLRINITYRTLS